MFTVNEMPSIGGYLGQAAAHGMSQSHERRKTAAGLQAMGMPAEKADQVAGLPPHLQEIALKSHQEQAGLDAFKEMFGMGKKKPTQQQPNALQGMIGRLFGPQQQDQGPRGPFGLQEPQQGSGPFGLPSEQPQQGTGPFGMQMPQNFMSQMMGGQQQPQENASQEQESFNFDPASMTPAQQMMAQMLLPKDKAQAFASVMANVNHVKAAELSAENIAKRQEETGIRAEKRQATAADIAKEKEARVAEHQEQVRANKEAADYYDTGLKTQAAAAKVYLDNLKDAREFMLKHKDIFGTWKSGLQTLVPEGMREQLVNDMNAKFANVELDKLQTMKGIKSVALQAKIGESKPSLSKSIEENLKLMDIMEKFAKSNIKSLKNYNKLFGDKAEKIPLNWRSLMDKEDEKQVDEIFGSPESTSKIETSATIANNDAQHPEGSTRTSKKTGRTQIVRNGQWEWQ